MKFQTIIFGVTWAGGQADETGESSSNAAQNLSEPINCAAAPSNICIIRVACWERSVGCQQHSDSTSLGLDQIKNNKTKTKLNKLKYGRLANKPAARWSNNNRQNGRKVEMKQNKWQQKHELALQEEKFK